MKHEAGTGVEQNSEADGRCGLERLLVETGFLAVGEPCHLCAEKAEEAGNRTLESQHLKEWQRDRSGNTPGRSVPKEKHGF